VRQDLDRLMQERGLAGMVVFANDRYCPAMYYAAGQKLHYGVYFRGSDGRAHLIHDPMERDQAAAVGCEHSSFPQHGLIKLMETEGQPARAFGRLIADTCASLGMRGPIALYGDLDASYGHALVTRLLEANPELRIDSSYPDLVTLARATKDEAEIEAIRRAARGTVAAIERLRDHLRSLRRDGDGFRHDGSGPVLLGDLRRLLQEEFLAHGLAEDGESIVSQGRDAGVPHNRGNDDEPLRAGVPLLVDVFPSEAGGGYHSDLTRTFCLGKAPEPLRSLYTDVHDAFRMALDRLAIGVPCRSLQEDVCEFYEKRGHATHRTREGTEEGYVHGLGHGVGLTVHEAPRLGGPPSNVDRLASGMVITVEPGLYYPSRGLGVRIEDLLLVRSDGSFENLTPAPYELEIEPQG
jgi:Xaa-Pro aminopeptidase